VEQALLKKQREEEERLWAIQQEHNRRQQVLADRDMKRKQRSMAEATKDTHAEQQKEFRQKWMDPYGEKGNVATNF
jgi:phosphoribosylaminoimidazole-succinocarboxamide synthase